ncbi:MAG: 3-deoxy-manno-octulosonate cytidylyltransferase [bacterium]|nr:3-deoxy-manno-octulosonate cytidylyltransferase [bacterium]
MRSLVIVPARLASTRLPNKPLLKINGTSMIRRTLERVLASGAAPVVLAADDQRILDEAQGLEGVIPVITKVEHSCGTERVLEAYRKVSADLGDFDVILNVQGDEPFIDPRMITQVLAQLPERLKKASFLTSVTEITEAEQADPNVAKVVLDLDQNALIFTRERLERAYKHTSVYIYTPEFLETFCALPPSPLETAYRLEQMRALDNGFKLNCIPLPFDAISINDEGDLAKAGVKDFEVFAG